MIRIDPNSLVDPKFLGIHYELGGKTFVKADCIGIAILWMKDQGFNFTYDDGQSPALKHWWEHNPWRLRNAIFKYGVMVPFSQVKKYDCLMFFLDETANQFPSCIGVMVDDRHFLTCLEGSGSKVYMLNKSWRARYFGAIRFHQVIKKMGK